MLPRRHDHAALFERHGPNSDLILALLQLLHSSYFPAPPI